jgi:hypothetical protein
MADSPREPYEPPVVEHVRFAPGEGAAAACKRIPAPPPNNQACNRGGVIQPLKLGS